MTFLFALLIWVLVLGLVLSIAIYAIRQLEWIAPPFKSVAVAIACLMAILAIVGAATGQIHLPGLRG